DFVTIIRLERLFAHGLGVEVKLRIGGLVLLDAKAVESDLMHRMGVTVAREVGDIPLGIGRAHISHPEGTAVDKDQLLAHPIGEPLVFFVGEAGAAGSREQNSEKQSGKGLSKSHDHVCASSPVWDG